MAARFRAILAEAADYGTNCLVSVSPNRRPCGGWGAAR